MGDRISRRPATKSRGVGALALQLIEYASASGLIAADMHNHALVSAVRIPLSNVLPTAPMIAAWMADGLDLDRLVVAAIHRTSVFPMQWARAIQPCWSSGGPSTAGV
jgi:phosphoribosylpyrophosphate synthetase